MLTAAILFTYHEVTFMVSHHPFWLQCFKRVYASETLLNGLHITDTFSGSCQQIYGLCICVVLPQNHLLPGYSQMTGHSNTSLKRNQGRLQGEGCRYLRKECKGTFKPSYYLSTVSKRSLRYRIFILSVNKFLRRMSCWFHRKNPTVCVV